MEKQRKDRYEIALKHLERAEQSLKAAKYLLDAHLFVDSVSRSYYAAYHAVYAVLYYLGLNPQTHKDLQNMIYLHLVQAKLVEPPLLKKISRLFSYRINADYGSIPIIDNEDAEESYDLAVEIVNTMQELFKGLQI